MQTADKPATIRTAFAERFGEDQTSALEAAANEHSNGVNSEHKGTDPFKWALLIAIGYQCMEVEGYREHHGITAPWDDLKAWIIEHADLASHDGDCDYLAMFCGAYDEFVGRESEQAA